MSGLDVRMDGYENPIGVLEQDGWGMLTFDYTEEYKKKPLNMSLGMPQEDAPFLDDTVCRAFFGNLIQERVNTLFRIVDRERTDLDNVGALLFHIGKDCAGAVTVLPRGAPSGKTHGNFETDYERLEEADMIELVKMLQNRTGLPDQFHDPSAIAGVQAKLALVVLPDGRFAQPVAGSGAPTTHILKVSNITRPNETLLEESLMKLSKRIGIETAEVVSMEFAGINTLLVTRYDREINEDGDVVRLHQEDLTQALGLLADWKYEEPDAKYYKYDVEAIAGIISNSSNSAKMRDQFITATVFDLMVGNNDAHAKNFSLLHREDGSFEFSPRYDLVPTRSFKNITDQLPYYIGNARTLREIKKENFNIFLTTLGIKNPSDQKEIYNRIVFDIGHKIAGELGALDKELADLIATNIQQLFKEFDLKIPDAVRGRDTFIFDSDKVRTKSENEK